MPFAAGPTVADGIATPKPVRVAEVLGALRRSSGGVVAVAEEEIAPALAALGRLGLFVEPTAATAGAALTRLLRDGTIAAEQTTVVVLTGTASRRPTASASCSGKQVRRAWPSREALLDLPHGAVNYTIRRRGNGEADGKVALITGAAGGQGVAEAELFVREGAAVVLTDIDSGGRRGAGGAASAQAARAARRCSGVQDVADEQAGRKGRGDAVAEFGGLHILVNNAGTIARQGIVNTTLEAWNRTLAVNLTGPLLGMKHAAPAIRDTVAKSGGGGSIINISSTAGLTAHDDAAYTASKWGLRGLTKTAVLQFSPWNIRVNSIHPGQIADTGFFQSGGEAFAHAARAAIPLHRQGTPQGMRRAGAVPRLGRSRALSAAPRSRSTAAISPPAPPACATGCAKISPPAATTRMSLRVSPPADGGPALDETWGRRV